MNFLHSKLMVLIWNKAKTLIRFTGSNDVTVQRSSIVFNQQLPNWTSDLNVPHCVYLWNKCSAVCQDRNPADGSCSFTVIKAAEELTRCFESLCGNVCVQIPNGMFSERLRFIPASQSGYLPHETHPRRFVKFPRCGPGGGLSHFPGVQRQSEHYSSSSANTRLARSEHTRQRRVSRRTGVHWECRGHTALINTVWYGSYKELVIGTHS